MGSERRKIALSIGNNNYIRSPLNNCVNDVIDVSAELKKVGFSVTTKTNLNHADMGKAINSFVDGIKPDDFVFFSFSGHGVQWNDQNYLMPCDDDRIEGPSHLEDRATNAQRALELMSAKSPFVILYILDCCRTYWLPKLARNRAIDDSSKGMAPMSPIAGSLIAFACAPGTTASDTAPNGRNGLFTYHLLRHVTKPGENIVMLLIDVAQAVMHETEGRQRPYTISGLCRRDVYLVPPETGELLFVTNSSLNFHNM